MGTSFSTDDILNKMNEIYNKKYKQMFNDYLLDLEFKTILSYYTGSGSIVFELQSLAGLPKTEVFLMVDYDNENIFTMQDEIYEKIIFDDIYKKYEPIYKLNKELCSRSFNKKIVIKNTNIKEETFALKTYKDSILIEINGKKLLNFNEEVIDCFNVVLCMDKMLSYNYNLE